MGGGGGGRKGAEWPKTENSEISVPSSVADPTPPNHGGVAHPCWLWNQAEFESLAQLTQLGKRSTASAKLKIHHL